MGGCDCICGCKCHADQTSAYPHLTCPDCIAAEEMRKKRKKELEEEDAEKLRQYNANLPSDAEIRRILG